MSRETFELDKYHFSNGNFTWGGSMPKRLMNSSNLNSGDSDGIEGAMKSGAESPTLLSAIKDFLAMQSWDPQVSVDVTDELLHASLLIPVLDDMAEMYIDSWHPSSIFQIAIRLPFNGDSRHKAELLSLINGIHNEHIEGRFQSLPDELDNAVCWIQRVDLEGMAASATAIGNIAQTGWRICEHYFSALRDTATIGTNADISLMRTSYSAVQSINVH